MVKIIFEKGYYRIWDGNETMNSGTMIGQFTTEKEAQEFLKSKPVIYIYRDNKYKDTHGEFMIYAYREYPYGFYVGHYKNIQDAQKKIDVLKPYRTGIPLSDALIDFQDHDNFGLELLTK